MRRQIEAFACVRCLVHAAPLMQIQGQAGSIVGLMVFVTAAVRAATRRLPAGSSQSSSNAFAGPRRASRSADRALVQEYGARDPSQPWHTGCCQSYRTRESNQGQESSR
jgi:hypothetical protein